MVTWLPALRLVGATLAQWVLYALGLRLGWATWVAFAVACVPGLWHLRPGAVQSLTVKALRAGLFPLSGLALWASLALPSWTWGAAAVAGLLIFPRLDRGSAPLWRSPAEVPGALAAAMGRLGHSARRALDPGCGLGDGVLALRAALPQAEVGGIEAAWGPWLVARLRCGATVRRGDMWALSWAGYDLVYLFLRPEAMEQARQKLVAELPPSALVASMDFEFERVRPVDVSEVRAGRLLRVYRVADLLKGSAR